MARRVSLVLFVVAVAVAATARGEMVEVTAPQTTVFDGKQYHQVTVQGERFIVYDAAKGWYLVPMEMSAGKKLVWLRTPDVKIDWGTTKTTRVTKVHDVNTIETSDGQRVQFAGIVVPASGPGASKTHARLRALLEGKNVTLEFDPSVFQNEHGAKVAYIYANGMFVNRELVKHGLARVVSTAVKGRYDAVFNYLENKAQLKHIGIWASKDSTEEKTPAKDENPSSTRWETKDQETQHVRHLSPTEKAQWARNLATEIKVVTERTKKELPARDLGEDCSGDKQKDYLEETCVSRALSITVRNGWAMALEGLAIKYEIFGKRGKKSSGVFLATAGETASISLAPGKTHEFTTDPHEFKGLESSKHGWKGEKYYGYRVTFLYQGTPVKVVAVPERLADWKSSKEGGT